MLAWPRNQVSPFHETRRNFVPVSRNKLAVWFKANKMAVNVSKTNYIIFHTRGKKVELNGLNVIFNSNDPDSANPDPGGFQTIEI